jgi:hypothetical protein
MYCTVLDWSAVRSIEQCFCGAEPRSAYQRQLRTKKDGFSVVTAYTPALTTMHNVNRNLFNLTGNDTQFFEILTVVEFSIQHSA